MLITLTGFMGSGKTSVGRIVADALGCPFMDLDEIIVKKAVDRLSSGIILVHNHPSGNPQPGGNDRTQTDALRRAAAVFDIVLIDHVIIGKNHYYSFLDNGEMTL